VMVDCRGASAFEASVGVIIRAFHRPAAIGEVTMRANPGGQDEPVSVSLPSNLSLRK
jgi:hypothetical protein